MQPLQCPAADVSFDRKVGKSTDFYNLWDTLSTDGAWTSQTDLVEKIAFDVKQAELDRDASFEMWENAAVQQQRAQGLSEDDLYVAPDTEIFRALAMAEVPVVEDGPTRNTAIVTFPQAVLMGAPSDGTANSSDVKVPTVLVKNTADMLKKEFHVVQLPQISDNADLLEEGFPVKFKDHRWKWPEVGAPATADDEYYNPLRTSEREFHLKNPPRVNRSAITLRDQLSPWFFQLGGPGKKHLDVAFPAVFVDDDCHFLEAQFLNRKITAEKFSWYLMSRMMGGAPGLIRLATLYEMHKQTATNKRQYNFYERVLGIDFFRSVDKKTRDLIRAMVPTNSGGAEAAARAAVIKGLPEIPKSMQSHFGHKFANWMDKFKEQHERKRAVDRAFF
ncbi:uncharacterized protein LOC129586759 [Paramacrobiotus metropolitanus]|uniref:uncharacterized protein LOC129586759 n=1 Tax=Paramacrobiotus metropolitanus TaxID=2943436 RepID=UPI002446420F|nr:uncharacterized protein LOC129586759 [Paramacrobiotus metropolitanus]